MMELDELKKELNLKINDQQLRSSDDIASILKTDTVSALQKIRKSILLEIMISVVFATLCGVVLFFSSSWMYYLLFSILAIVAVVFITVLYFLLNKINSTLHINPVKQNLQKLIIIIEEYTKRYRQLTLFLLPVCFALGVWLSYNDPENVLRPLTLKTISILVAVMVLLGLAVYHFTKWYLRKLYGNYIAQLKALLNELNEE